MNRARLPAGVMLLLSMAVVSGLTGCSRELQPADIRLELPQPSPPLVDVVLLLDQSGSMWGPRGTDPDGIRAEAARYLIASVSEKSIETRPNRVAVVHFGDDVSPDPAELLSVSPASGFTEAADLVDVRNMGNTNIIGALRSALGGLEAGGTFEEGRKGAVVLFTDGEPFDARRLPTNTYFEEISEFVADQLTPRGVELYVIAVDLTGDIWKACAPYWQRIAGADRIACLDSMGGVRGKFNEVLNQVFDIPNVPPDVLTRGRKSFTVKPYLDRVEFHVFPATPEMKLRILRPDGKPVKPDSDGDARQRRFKGYEIISVFDPQAGEWRYEVTEGEGRVEVYRNEVPLQMKMVLPTTVHPQGRHIQIVASFARHSGKPVESEPEYPLGLSAQVLGPTGPPANVEFHEPVHGYYYGQPAVPTNMPGLYKVTLRVQAGKALDTSVSYHVNAGPHPYLEMEAPKIAGFPFLQQFVAVSGTLMLAGKPTQAEKHFTNNPNHLYLAQLSSMPDGTESPVQWLTADGNRFGTRFTLPMQKRLFIQQPVPGQSVLHVEHAGTPIEAKEARCNDVSMQTVRVETTPWGTVLRALIALVLVYVAVVALSWVRLSMTLLFRARRMNINVKITHSKTNTPLVSKQTAGKRFTWVRTKPWQEPDGKSTGKKPVRVPARRFVLWGVDRAGNEIGYARFVYGIALPSRLRKGQGRNVGQIKLQA